MQWADKGVLSTAQKRQWAESVIKIAGRDRPDFAFAVLAPMFRSTENPQEQSALWDWAAAEFRNRPDLVAAARLWQGRAWEKAGDNGRAYDAYKDINARYPNDGQNIIHALARAEALLHKNGKDAAIVGLYEDAFRRVTKPSQLSPGFEFQTNYFQVGFRYAELLSKAGREADAARVRRQIGVPDAPPSKRG